MTRPFGGTRSTTLADIAEVTVGDLTQDDSIVFAMAERVLSAAPRSFALAGLSMGGYVAQEIMRQAPERVERLALVDTNARADTEAQVATRRELIRLSGIGQVQRRHAAASCPISFASGAPQVIPQIAGVITEMAERIGQAAFHRQQQAIMTRKDGRPDLEAIRVPTLIACGRRQDTVTPVELHAEMHGLIAGSKFVVVGGRGPFDAPGTAACRDRPDALLAVIAADARS